MVQLKGALLVSVFAFVAYIVFSILKVAMGVRVSEEEEDRGLDIAEHDRSLRFLILYKSYYTKKGIIK